MIRVIRVPIQDAPHDALFKAVFGDARTDADRERILLQTLALYLVNLYDMQPTEVQALSQSLPEAERDQTDEIPAVFGEKWRREGRREGRAEE